MRRIAAGLELWFERPGFPPVPPHRPSCHARGNAVRSGAAPNIITVVGGKRSLNKAVFLVEERIEQCWCLGG